MPLLAALGLTTWVQLRDHLRQNYVHDETEAARRAAALERVEFYEGRGEPYMEQMIDRLFSNDKNRQLRRAALKESKFTNAVQRIVNTKATVYSEPARRKANDLRYTQFLKLLDHDALMRQLNRMLVLHEDVWVQYRVRLTTRRLLDEDGAPQLDAEGRPMYELEPVVDLVPPSLFWAISAPRDATLHVATLIDQRPSSASAHRTDPHYRLWGHDETVLLDADLNLASNPEPWTLGRMPGFLATMRVAGSCDRLLALSPAADIVAATKFVWFQNAMLLKESKSANRQAYMSGDTTAATMGQVSDSEHDAFLPEGVTVQTVDRGNDQQQYRDNADHALERAGANHNIPPSVLKHDSGTSGAEVFIRERPLRQVRQEQVPDMRKWERELAETECMVNRQDLPDYAFSMRGWGVDFGEVQQPLTRQEELDVFETERRLLLTDTPTKERERNPDLETDEQAFAEIQKRVENETRRVQMTQELQQMNGSTSSAPGEATAKDNGAAGRQAAGNATPAPNGKPVPN